MRFILALFALLLVQSYSDAQVAKITGPKERRTGRLVVLKTNGTVGDDLQITTNAVSTEWYAVQMKDGSIGIIYETETPGDYAFAIAVNKDGKTATAIWMVKIVDPTPGPTPGPAPGPIVDDFTKKLQTGYTLDSPTTPDDRKQLAANYKAAIASIIPDCKTQKDLQDQMKALNDQTIKSRVPNLRHAVATAVIETMGTQPDLALDQQKAKTLWNKLVDSLGKLTP